MKRKILVAVVLVGVVSLSVFGVLAYLKYRGQKEIYFMEGYDQFVPEDAKLGLNKKK